MRTRGKVRASLDAATQAVLRDPDLLGLILDHHATGCRGWCREFFTSGEVCKLWSRAAQAAGGRMSGWNEHTWYIPDLRKVHLDGVLLATSTGGAYDWGLRVLPSVRRCHGFCSCGGLPADGKGAGLDRAHGANNSWCKYGKIGLFLEVPKPLPGERPEEFLRNGHGETLVLGDQAPWARRTECEMVLHDQRSRAPLPVGKFFRHQFDHSSSDWGWGSDNEAFATSQELSMPGCRFVDAGGGIKVRAALCRQPAPPVQGPRPAPALSPPDPKLALLLYR